MTKILSLACLAALAAPAVAGAAPAVAGAAPAVAGAAPLGARSVVRLRPAPVVSLRALPAAAPVSRARPFAAAVLPPSRAFAAAASLPAPANAPSAPKAVSATAAAFAPALRAARDSGTSAPLRAEEALRRALDGSGPSESGPEARREIVFPIEPPLGIPTYHPGTPERALLTGLSVAVGALAQAPHRLSGDIESLQSYFDHRKRIGENVAHFMKAFASSGGYFEDRRLAMEVLRLSYELLQYPSTNSFRDLGEAERMIREQQKAFRKVGEAMSKL